MRRSVKGLFAVTIAMMLLFTSVCSAFATDNKGKGWGQFKDVDINFWGYQAIMDLTQRGIINGYTDNTFRPNANVTRAEFAALLVRTMDLKATGNTQTFADVPPSSWYYESVEASKNFLTGYKNSSGALYFYGDRNAVREDMAVALVKALNLPATPNDNALQRLYSDYSSISPALRGYVYAAYQNKLMQGGDGKFEPQANLTRAQAAQLLMNVISVMEKIAVGDNGEEKVPVDGSNPAYAQLNGLTYNNTAVSGFKAATYNYNVELPAGTTSVPTVRASVPSGSGASVVITQVTSLPGVAVVKVTSSNNSSVNVYTVNFAVKPSLNSDAALRNLTYNGKAVSGFDANTLTYNVALPAGTTELPVVAATARDSANASVSIAQATRLPGSATVTVTAQDKTTKNVYKINFTVAANTEATLKSLTYNNIAVPEFASDKFSYSVQLPAGTTAVPTVRAAAQDRSGAKVTVTQAPGLPGVAIVKVVSASGTVQNVYTINFTVAPLGSVDTLSNLTYNGIRIPGFSPNTLTYNLTLPEGTTAIPVVAATATDTEGATLAVTQAAGLPGTATAEVTAQNGTKKVYTVNFTVANSLSGDATLKNLTYNGTAVPGFAPTTTVYTITLPYGTTVVPTVVATANDTDGATVVTINAQALPGSTIIAVTAADGTTQNTYEIKFNIARR